MQRDISKRDLASAVRYGTKEQTYSHKGELRWKYTHADIVFITDYSSKVEVTAWALELPLQKVPIAPVISSQHREAKRRIASSPDIITSHHVFVVDMSASMRESDMNGHRTRFRAVYFALAEQFTYQKVASGCCTSGYDVVSVIEMRDGAEIVMELEPISGVLFNKFVDLAERPFGKDGPARSHGNYLPSIKKAFELLRKYDHSACTPSLFLLSDGRPSDPWTSYHGTPQQKELVFMLDLLHIVGINCRSFSGRLTLTCVGYGSIKFDVLLAITATACYSNAKEAKFVQTSIDPDAMSTAISSLISSTTETRSTLSRLTFATGDARELTKSTKEKYDAASVARLQPAEWRVFRNHSSDPTSLQACERLAIEYFEHHGSFKARCKKVSPLHPSADGIRVKKNHFGEGAERIVYEMMEIDTAGQSVGVPLVAKDSKHLLLDRRDARDFHFSFMKTQHKASNRAKKFNDLLNRLGIDKIIPRIAFLDCFVYGVDHGNLHFLAEKRLDPARYLKYNDNAGKTDGVQRVNVNFKPAKIESGAIQEGDEEAESDDEPEDDGAAHLPYSVLSQPSKRILDLQMRVLPQDVPQAFSHWTHVNSKRNELVCDLQGVLVESPSGPVFEFTDPCIHIRGRGRRHGHDRTDRGDDGIDAFFRSHICNPLCDILMDRGKN